MKKIYNIELRSIGTTTVYLEDCILHIRYPEINHSYWKGLIPYENDYDIQNILTELLWDLDCTKLFDGRQVLTTKNYSYEKFVSDYYYYLIHLDNYKTYNHYFDLLLATHSNNVTFEYNHIDVSHVTKAKTKAIKKAKLQNKFIRQVTTDMFSNKTTYIYSNAVTGEIINSDDEFLLDTLNGTKKKVKIKRSSVPLSSMQFVFKKKT